MSPFNAAGADPRDPRLARARRWLDGVAAADVHDLQPASSDASFRRYFRVTAADGRTWILMDAPPSREPLRPFLDVARWIAECGVRVPEVLAADVEQGFALIGDLGTEDYLSRLRASPESAERLYRDAIDALVRLQSAGARHCERLPDYGVSLLAAEVELFREWCCRRHLGLALADTEEGLLDEAREALCRAARAQPRVFVHRDYHSRNLMVLPADNPGVLDFQDAVSGPLTYDLVSLLKDCYIAWPEPDVARWLAYYHERALRAGLPAGTLETLRERFDWMGVQRHLKAAGIFARLCHRDGKPGYLADIPRTLAYVQAVCATTPTLAPLGDFLARRVMPGLASP